MDTGWKLSLIQKTGEAQEQTYNLRSFTTAPWRLMQHQYIQAI